MWIRLIPIFLLLGMLWYVALGRESGPPDTVTIEQAYPRAVLLIRESGCPTGLLSAHMMNCALEFYGFEERAATGEPIERTFSLLEACVWCIPGVRNLDCSNGCS